MSRYRYQRSAVNQPQGNCKPITVSRSHQQSLNGGGINSSSPSGNNTSHSATGISSHIGTVTGSSGASASSSNDAQNGPSTDGTYGRDSSSAQGSNSNQQPPAETRIEDGKLWYERRWFHRGQPVHVEGRDIPRFSANISAIGIEAICVKKTSDGQKVRIFLSQLRRGEVAIKRRAN